MRRILLLSHEDLNRVVLKPELRDEILPMLRNSCANMLGEGDKGVALLDQIR